MKFLITIFLFSLHIAHASIPTLEGLLRNPNNPDLVGNLVVVKLILSFESPEVEGEEKGITGKKKSRYFKFLVSLENEGKFEVLQAEYLAAEMAPTELLSIRHFKDFSLEVNAASTIAQHFVYSLFSMHALNSSQMFTAFLRKNTLGFQSNMEIMNKEKIRIMEDYKKYLMAIKSDDALKEQLISPLTPKDEEMRVKVKELLKQSMYQNTGQVRLTKHNDQLIWQASLGSFSAQFSNEEHRLTHMSFDDGKTAIAATVGEYVLFNGVQELPKSIELKIDSQSFELKYSVYKVLQSKNKKFSERLSEYKEELAKSSIVRNPTPTKLAPPIRWPILGN